MLPLQIKVSDPSHVSEARRRTSAKALELGWSEKQLGTVELIVTELAKNLTKHTREGGELLIWGEGDESRSLTLLAVDKGPGIRNVSRALADGYSTAGSPGTGLGAVQRMASCFDIYSSPDVGTTVVARIDAHISTGARASGDRYIRASSLRLPKPGETSCGDGVAWERQGNRFLAFLVDGLGHGVMAAEAAEVAVRTFRKNSRLPPEELLAAVHLALRATRGGVAAVAEIDSRREMVSYAGIGNINGVVYSEGGSRNMVSYNGTLGQEVRKVQKFTYPWSNRSVLVMHSDGMSNRWDLAANAGLGSRAPALIAGMLYAQNSRGRDDVSILVAREDSS